MKYDICDGLVSLVKPEALKAWNGMIHAFLAHGTETPTHLGAVLKAEPDFAMGYAAKGLFSMMMGRKELIAVAREAHETALKAHAGSLREQQWVVALAAWLEVSHAIRFILGDGVGMRASIERVLPAHDAAHPLRGYLLGCHAFTLEETGEYKAAEAAGLEGLQRAPPRRIKESR